MSHIVVAAFYQFVSLPDYCELQADLQAASLGHSLRGTILLATEGINGTVAGQRDDIDAFMRDLKNDARFSGLEYKESQAEDMPFHRMKVRLKKEIVTMGVPDTDPASLVGTYLDAQAWNDMLTDPEVIVIDTRNEYEVAIGSFVNARSPDTKSFREFPDYVDRELADKKDKKIAMFCTGGIRCEKATSYLRANGFEQVFHLQGGILRYLETAPPEQNLWQGECFVFDDRVSVDKNLNKGVHNMCHACRRPISPLDEASPHYRAGVSCPYCIDDYSPEQRRGFAEREKQVRLAEARGVQHIGIPQPDRNDQDDHER